MKKGVRICYNVKNVYTRGSILTEIKIIKCSSYADCAEVLTKKLKCTRAVDERNVIFCEDKLTLTIEKAVLKKCGGSFDTVVTTFKRYLSSHVNTDKVLNKSGSAVVVKKILSEHNSEFGFVCKKNYRGLPLTVYNLISQLVSSSVTPEDVLDCAEKTEGILSAKLHDIYLAYKLYFNEIEGRWLDSGTYLDKLPKAIEEDADIKKQDVYLVGYSSWTAQACEIVKSLIKNAKSVTLLAVCGENEGFFLNETYKKFVALCGRLKTPYDEESYFPKNEKQSVRLIRENLYNPKVFSPLYQPAVDEKGVYVYTAKDIADECEYVAKIIRNGIVNEGKRYRDFAVAVGNTAEYGGTVKRVFAEYEIPVFCDEKKKLSDSLTFRFIERSFAVAEQNFDKDDVYALIENKLFLNDFALKDEYTKKAKAFGFNRTRFLRGFSDGSLSVVTEWLKKIKEIIPKKGKAQDFAEAVASLFLCFDVDKKIEKICKKSENYGDTVESAFLTQCSQKINELLKTVSDLSGESVLKTDEYLQLIKAGAEANEISVIPQSSDAVYVAEIKDVRLRKIDTLFAIGLNGDIPFGKTDTALLTDADIDCLEDLQRLIEPKVALVNEREKENLCLALTSFENKLVLTCSVKTGKGEKNSKSEIITYAEKIFGKKISKSFADIYDSRDENVLVKTLSLNYSAYKPAVKEFVKECSSYAGGMAENLDAPSSFYRATDESLKEKLKDMVSDNKKPYATEELKESLARENISVSRLETYFSCPYKEYADYGLKLKEEDTGDVKSLDIGNIIHDVLDAVVSELPRLKDKKEAETLAVKRAEEIISSDEYKVYAETARGNYRLKRTASEAVRISGAVYEQFEYSDFKPAGTEIAFGKGEKYDGVIIKGEKGDAVLNGKIDRVDVYDKYVRVVDYKTGAELKNTEELLYTGNKIQAFLYMHALKSLGKIPSGVYYEYIKDSYTKADENEYTLNGYTLNSEEIVRASDKRLTEKGTSNLLEVTLAGDGKVKDKKSVLNEETFDAFVEYSYKIAESGVSDMQRGFIAPTPYEGACEYCKYNALCGFQNNVTGVARRVTGVSNQTILNVIDKKGGEE